MSKIKSEFERPGKVKGQARIIEARYPKSDEVQIGSVLLFRLDLFLGQKYTGVVGLRPVVVQALWRDQNQKVKQVEVLYLNPISKNPYPHDYDMVTPLLEQKFRSNRQSSLNTTEIHIADYTSDLFRISPHPVIDDSLWPGIIARRVAGLLYSPVTDLLGNIRPGLVREGLTYDDIPFSAVYSGKWAPDLPGGKFTRIPSDVLDTEIVQGVARYAASYSAPKAGSPSYTFGEPETWNLKIPFRGYPNWGHRDPFATTQDPNAAGAGLRLQP